LVVSVERGQGVTVFVDGQSQFTAQQFLRQLANDAPLGLGGADGYPSLDGALDEVAVYNTALTGPQIAGHHTAGRGGGADGYAAAVRAHRPVGWWRLDEPAAAEIADATGNGHHGAPVGAVTLGAAGLHPAAPPSQPPASTTARYLYDDADRLVALAGHDGSVIGYAYDADANTTSAGADRFE